MSQPTQESADRHLLSTQELLSPSLSEAQRPLYYLHNFRHLLTTVEHQYGDLLSPEESERLTRFHQLNEPAQALLVRLFSRRHDLFRRDRLEYPEISDLDAALNELEEQHWIVRTPTLDAATELEQFTCQELRHYFREDLPRGAYRAKKPELIALLETLPERVIADARPFTLIQLLTRPLSDLLQLLFFSSWHQDLSTFITAQLGLIRYETYPLHTESRYFHSRAEIEAATRLAELRNQFYQLEAFEEQSLASLLEQLPMLQESSPLQARHDRLVLRIGMALERQQCWETALTCYAKARHPQAVERSARVYARMGMYEDAIRHCQSLATGARGEAAQLFAANFIHRCEKALGKSPAPRRRFKPVEWGLQLPQRGQRVEIAVLEHLHSPDAPCFYVENWLMNAVFGLTFWDVWFADVRGAFTHPFQRAPHDLYEIEFCQRRQTAYEKAWSVFQSHQWLASLEARWHDKFGLANPFVGWSEDGWPVLQLAIAQIPKPHWQAFFDRIFANLRDNTSGLPDLIQFTQEGYRLIEVKGPGDKVQPNQSRWMQYFTKMQIPYKVAVVTWQDACSVSEAPPLPTMAGASQ